ncbi:MAG: hypothetical protein MI744_02285 [Pseudomonadales bacterium]|nr:hypothetical protein [Pseudomonadales bacterium]
MMIGIKTNGSYRIVRGVSGFSTEDGFVYARLRSREDIYNRVLEIRDEAKPVKVEPVLTWRYDFRFPIENLGLGCTPNKEILEDAVGEDFQIIPTPKHEEVVPIEA